MTIIINPQDFKIFGLYFGYYEKILQIICGIYSLKHSFKTIKYYDHNLL